MAAVARPTWSEVQLMDDTTLTAIAIVRGQMTGDTFLWDHEYWDDKTGMLFYGRWKSLVDKEKRNNDGRVDSGV